jgi:hypothetical protein
MSWVVNLFENISPYIRSLAIRPTVGVDPSAESLDNHLLACHSELLRCGLGLSFASLTTVQIGHNALYSILFIPFLCNSAPHLISLGQRSIMLGIEQVSMEADSYVTDVELIR